MTTGPGKRCTGPCGLVQPLGRFSPHPLGADGRQSRCRDCMNEATRACRAANAAAVFGHYGTACACCGATEDLTIDHADGGGAAHREELFGDRRQGGYVFYAWLIAQGFPEGYQTMCRPCNKSKGGGAACRLWHGDPGKKRCAGPCGQVKDLEEFGRTARKSGGGRAGRCRDCRNAGDRASYAERRH